MRASTLFAAYVVFTLISGAAQDMLYTSYKFFETDAMSLIQSIVLFVLGAISYALALGISIAGNVLLTNYATEFLSFPIQVVFKSSKLLMAMFVRAVIFRKPNKRIDYYCAIMLSLGLIGFMWPSSSHKEDADEGEFDPTAKFSIGLICVIGSLIAEAVMLNVQEFYLFQRYEVSTEWVMMYGYLYSTISQAVLLGIMGTFTRTMVLLAHLETEIAALMFAFPFFMWIGVTFLLFLVKDYGAVVASAANVVRKVIAVAFSFVYFGRPVTVPIVVGGIMVFGSIVWRSLVTEGHGSHEAHKPKVDKRAASPVDTITASDEEQGGIGGGGAVFEATPWPGVVPEAAALAFTVDVDENPDSSFSDVDLETQPLTGIRKSRTNGRVVNA